MGIRPQPWLTEQSLWTTTHGTTLTLPQWAELWRPLSIRPGRSTVTWTSSMCWLCLEALSGESGWPVVTHSIAQLLGYGLVLLGDECTCILLGGSHVGSSFAQQLEILHVLFDGTPTNMSRRFATPCCFCFAGHLTMTGTHQRSSGPVASRSTLSAFVSVANVHLCQVGVQVEYWV